MAVGDVRVTCTDKLIIFFIEINFRTILALAYQLQKVGDNLLEILFDFYSLVLRGLPCPCFLKVP